MAILHSHHIAIRATDFERSRAFYTEVLGFSIKGQIPGRDIVFVDIGGTTIELYGGAAAAPQRPEAGFVHLAFECDDVDATYADLAAKGVEFHIPPRGMGDMRVAFFTDPDGNVLELFQSKALSWTH